MASIGHEIPLLPCRQSPGICVLTRGQYLRLRECGDNNFQLEVVGNVSLQRARLYGAHRRFGQAGSGGLAGEKGILVLPERAKIQSNERVSKGDSIISGLFGDIPSFGAIACRLMADGSIGARRRASWESRSFDNCSPL